MSWSVVAAGNAHQLRESVRRHEHHFWRHIADGPEAEIRRMVLGHALRMAEANPDLVYTLVGDGHSSRDSFTVSVHLTPFHPLDPVPAEDKPSE
jgi:hypothetical protein